MIERISLVALLGVLTLAGCSDTQPSKPATVDYFTIKMGTPIDEVIAQLGNGELQEHDDLKVSTKPRDSDPKLPADVDWHVWTRPGNSLLVLGVVNGKIIYKRVERHNGVDGQFAVEVADEYRDYQRQK